MFFKHGYLGTLNLFDSLPKYDTRVYMYVCIGCTRVYLWMYVCTYIYKYTHFHLKHVFSCGLIAY